MIARGGGQGAGGTFLESLCPSPTTIAGKGLGGPESAPNHISKMVLSTVKNRRADVYGRQNRGVKGYFLSGPPG